MTDPQQENPNPHEPADADGRGRECDDAPKLTAEEWAYIQAMTDGGDG